MARLHRTASTNSSLSNTTGGSFLWTWLLCGLAATLINIFYEAGTTLGRLHTSRFDLVHGELILEPSNHQSTELDPNQPKLEPVKSDDSEGSDEQQEQAFRFDQLDEAFRKDKGPLLDLIRDAGLEEQMDRAKLERLPSWSQVTALYGDKPIFRGLNDGQCERFQNSPNVSWHFVSTAGTFNTGTNLMAELLIANCHMPEHEKLPRPHGGAGVRWQVLWGKHTPVDDEHFRLTHKTYKDENLRAEYMFPAVMVRDPYKWMQSMCRHKYAASWPQDRLNATHCPNLLDEKNQSVPVKIKYAEFERHHKSLVAFWNDWYGPYFEAKFPHLIIRFEDLIYYPRHVVQTVCECAGGQLRNKFRYIVDSAKKGDAAHGAVKTSYLDALIRYGTKQGRYKGFQPSDLEFASAHLNPNMMRLLGYPFHENSQLDAGT